MTEVVRGHVAAVLAMVLRGYSRWIIGVVCSENHDGKSDSCDSDTACKRRDRNVGGGSSRWSGELKSGITHWKLTVSIDDRIDTKFAR